MQHYSIGYHSSDIECPHVALITDGKVDEIFDVRLPFNGDGGDETDPAYVEGLAALTTLLERANAAIATPTIDVREAITRLQDMQDEVYADAPEDAEEREQWMNDIDSEEYGSLIGADNAYAAALDVLHLLAQGK